MSNTANIEKYLSAHLAIRALLDRYNDIVNHRNWLLLHELFATGSTWCASDPINLRFEGKDAIITGLPISAERMEVLIQTTSGVVVEVMNEGKAKVRSLLSEFGRSRENGQGFHAVCTYHDTIVWEQGEWKFMTRTLELHYFDQLPVPGNIAGYKY